MVKVVRNRVKISGTQDMSAYVKKSELKKYIGSITDITYDELVDRRNNEELIGGANYRIIDYVCTSSLSNTACSDYKFDIIVQAVDGSHLSEIARAYREDDASLNSWELKYCLDNDTSRFSWADEENGKGVIYYLKDNNGNEAPYDFKNIMFKKDDTYAFTFTTLQDDVYVDISNECYGNVIKKFVYDQDGIQELNNIILEKKEYNINNNSFGNNCKDNYLVDFYNNKIGDEFSSNIVNVCAHDNIMGNYFMGNTIDSMYHNKFGSNFGNNIIGLNCDSNEFMNYINGCKFGDEFDQNIIGNGNEGNIFGISCFHNHLGSYCRDIYLGDQSCGNTFGDHCLSVCFVDSQYVRFCYIDSGVENVSIQTNTIPIENSPLRFIHIHSDVKNKNILAPLGSGKIIDIYSEEPQKMIV